MTRIARPARSLAGAIVLTCFSVGFVGAYGAHAIDTRIAVGEARAAAHEIDTKRAALEESLAEAHGAVRDAERVVDEARVAAAAHALSSATQEAADEAARSGIVVDLEPIAAEVIAEGGTVAEATGVAREAAGLVADLAEASPEPSAAETPSDANPPRPAVAAAEDDEAPTAQPDEPQSTRTAPASAALIDLLEEVEVARVLAGETNSADEARGALTRLEEASRALDVALAALDGGASALSEATLAAEHGDTLLLLDAAVLSAESAGAHATITIDEVGDRVIDEAAIQIAERALVGLMSASATAEQVNRAEPDRVVSEFDSVVSARVDFDAAMESLRGTHEEWIDRENTAIDARNESVLEAHEKHVATAREEHVQANLDAVQARANGWTGQPAGVVGSNGALDFDSLCEVDFAPGHRLQCDAALSLERANEAYVAATGTNLVMTDSYRSYGLQVRTRALKPATAARPGTSNHGWGMAVDLDQPSARWLSANGAEYGWVNPVWARPGGVKPEWWHLEYVATDVGAFVPPAPPAPEERITSAFATATAKTE
ncbi:MAG: D-alanyl-D-alanine carboxypeptidase family protein [Demequina sp.]